MKKESHGLKFELLPSSDKKLTIFDSFLQSAK